MESGSAEEIMNFLGVDVGKDLNCDLGFSVKDYLKYEQNLVRVRKNHLEVYQIIKEMKDKNIAINNGIK
jgi:hypothetical protein